MTLLVLAILCILCLGLAAMSIVIRSRPLSVVGILGAAMFMILLVSQTLA